MPQYEVTSEIYSEFNYKTNKIPSSKGNVISEFPFNYTSEINGLQYDEDGDLLINRCKESSILIEHSISTKLDLVGLQVWRGAFLLADLLLYWGKLGKLKESCILELGAGTGLTSFIGSMFAKKVICTDVDIGGILSLMKVNKTLNENIIKSDFLITELDFTKEFSPQIKKELSSVDIVLAADVIYDDTLTESFINVIENLLNCPPNKKILIALEKRFVFTLADLDSVAPCYETFIALLDKVKYKNISRQWKIKQVPIDFPQYFKYDRVKELILWEISSK